METKYIYNELNQNKSKSYLDNLKSDYFLPKIFDYIQKKKFLQILKFNKKLQKRLKLNIHDYKEYSQYYSSVELKITLADDKYGKFINISGEQSKYYHIYFDNSAEEIKRNYLNEDEKVKMIKIIINSQVKSFKGLFYDCKCIESIIFNQFVRVDIINMSRMFDSCTSLEKLDLSNLITNNVKSMSHMFSNCKSLKELNISNFNTNNVTNMSGMFSCCCLLKSLIFLILILIMLLIWIICFPIVDY